MPKLHIKSNGFTIIELMVTLAVVAILASIAAPNFMNMIRDTRIVTQTNNLVGSLQLARSEAAKQGVQVTVRHHGNTASNWDGGWDVFTDWDGDGVYDDDGDGVLCEVEEDCILRTQTALANSLTLRTGDTFIQWLAYQPSGFPVGLGTDTFRLCASNGDTTNSRSVVVNNTGRPRTELGTMACP